MAVALAGPDGKPGNGSSAFDNLDSALRDFLAELVHTYDFTGKQVQLHGTSSCMQQHPHVPGQLLCCALLSSAGSTMDAHVGTSQWSCMEKYANALAATLLCSALLAAQCTLRSVLTMDTMDLSVTKTQLDRGNAVVTGAPVLPVLCQALCQ